MADCKDCLSYDVCEMRKIVEDNYPERHYTENNNCEHFKDRSKFAELHRKVGDTVYVLSVDSRIKAKSIRVISILESNVIYYFDDGKFNSSLNDYCCENDFGETVFHTRKEAKKALEERENDFANR